MSLTGHSGKCLELLKTALAASSNFQSLVSAADAASAAEKIFMVQHPGTDDEGGEITRPLAVIHFGDGDGLQFSRIAAGPGLNSFSVGNSATVVIEQDLKPYTYDAMVTFCNVTDAINKDILDYYSSAEMLEIQSGELLPPGHFDNLDSGVIARPIRYQWGID